MTTRFLSLNSGSNGNAYYVGNDREAVLIDAGISCREIENRLKKKGLNPGNIKALFVSHEHSDHIRGVETLSRKLKIPVFITRATLKSSGLKIQDSLVESFRDGEEIIFGDLRVRPFRKFHDAADPHSFLVKTGEHSIGILTDIGRPCEKVQHYFGQCHAVFLESNYDPKMLEEGGYPLFLKRRISNGNGHLSNFQALDLFLQFQNPRLKVLLLSHLSQNNNHPHLALSLFSPHAGKVRISVAPRFQESPLFEWGKEKILPPVQASRQLTLF